MNKTRPMNLDLTTMAFPPMAIASILHRISGVVLFVLLPFILFLLHLSLKDASSFTDVQLWLVNPYCKVTLWIFASAACYHVLAGIRHMVMDCGIGESVEAGRVSAIVVILLGIISVVGLGVWIW